MLYSATANTMSCIKSVVCANDEQLVALHKFFVEWKQENLHLATTNYGWACRHYKSRHRAINKICPTFTSAKSYACAIATTYIIGKKIYWKSQQDPGWKQCDRSPPPVARNLAPTKVLFSHERDAAYRCLSPAFYWLWMQNKFSHWYFATRIVFIHDIAFITQEILQSLFHCRLCPRRSAILWREKQIVEKNWACEKVRKISAGLL